MNFLLACYNEIIEMRVKWKSKELSIIIQLQISLYVKRIMKNLITDQSFVDPFNKSYCLKICRYTLKNVMNWNIFAGWTSCHLWEFAVWCKFAYLTNKWTCNTINLKYISLYITYLYIKPSSGGKKTEKGINLINFLF